MNYLTDYHYDAAQSYLLDLKSQLEKTKNAGAAMADDFTDDLTSTTAGTLPRNIC